MTALYLKEEDVRELMDVPTAIDLLETAFRAWGEGRAMNIPRQRARAGDVMLHSMSAGAEYLGLLGWKNYTTSRTGARFHVALYDAETGAMQAFIEANALGQMRTGAVSGLATRYMARPESQFVGLFGTGFQAETQLEAVCAVRKIEEVEVYGRDDDRRNAFAEKMSRKLGVEVIPSHVPNDTAAEKDIVITATSSRTPLFDGRVLDEGTHLNVIGSNFWKKAEIDVTTVRRADVIVCDSIEQCRIEAGDFAEAIASGATDWGRMHDLSEVIAGQKTPRAVSENITLFKSVGLALEDVALAGEILLRARASGRGWPLPF